MAHGRTTLGSTPGRHDRIAFRLLADKVVHDALTEAGEYPVCGLPPVPSI
jgi:hypothetical protein